VVIRVPSEATSANPWLNRFGVLRNSGLTLHPKKKKAVEINGLYLSPFKVGC
jgi:hypothetical protein